MAWLGLKDNADDLTGYASLTKKERRQGRMSEARLRLCCLIDVCRWCAGELVGSRPCFERYF